MFFLLLDMPYKHVGQHRKRRDTQGSGRGHRGRAGLVLGPHSLEPSMGLIRRSPPSTASISFKAPKP